MVNKAMLRKHPYVLSCNQRMMAGNSMHLLQVNILFIMKGEMKWYIVKPDKESPNTFECCVQNVYQRKWKQTKENTNTLNCLDPFLSPPYSSSFIWQFVPMGLVTFLVVSNDLFHTVKEQSSQFCICIYSSCLLMRLVSSRKTNCDYSFWFITTFPFVRQLFYSGN